MGEKLTLDVRQQSNLRQALLAEERRLPITLIVTLGGGSMDMYSRYLAEHLDVNKVYTNIYQRSAELFNVSLISKASIWSLLEDVSFAKALEQAEGILHLPNHHMGRYGLFIKKPFIITVHDLIRFFDMRGGDVLIHRPNLRDRVYLHMDYAGVRKAVKIIAVSNTTKKDLMNYLKLPSEKIAVVYEGVDHDTFKPVKRRLIDEPYILYVGSEHPRKNLTRILAAFKKVKQDPRFKDLKLVKVGEAGGREADFRSMTLKAIERLKLKDDVIFVGKVAKEDLPAYYSHAECFVMPSLYEGFGLPLLEAMACGCPVITSNISAPPEVTADAALHVNPRCVEDIASAIISVLSNDELRCELKIKGLKRAKEFSWEKTAKETFKVYKEVVEQLGF